MQFDLKLKQVQQKLTELNWDGWLLYNYRRSNDLACDFLEISPEALITRRFLYWIPQKGKPIKIVHAIEEGVLNHLPGEKITFQTWKEWEERIQDILISSRVVAMEYSPRNALPNLSKVDAGIVDLIRQFAVQVVSSAPLLQHFTGIWNGEKWKLHREAADALCRIVDKVWGRIAHFLKEGKLLTEFDVQQFMAEQFGNEQCHSDDLPICAVNANSANPHYSPNPDTALPIQKGDLILIDLWCKKKVSQAVYADITRVAMASSEPPPLQNSIFHIVRQAQKAATKLVEERFLKKQPVMGWEVDQAARNVIQTAGYGDYFIHRTGHNIDTKDHGNGANIDNYETHDDRLLLPRTCFSIEPGIYLPGKFGIRLEYDVFIHEDGKIQTTGGEQDELLCLFKQ